MTSNSAIQNGKRWAFKTAGTMAAVVLVYNIYNIIIHYNDLNKLIGSLVVALILIPVSSLLAFTIGCVIGKLYKYNDRSIKLSPMIAGLSFAALAVLSVVYIYSRQDSRWFIMSQGEILVGDPFATEDLCERARKLYIQSVQEDFMEGTKNMSSRRFDIMMERVGPQLSRVRSAYCGSE